MVRLKAYSNAGSTWLGDVQVAVPLLVGIGSTAGSGFVVFTAILALRVCAGWLDLERIHATDYLMEFLGKKAPARVIIREAKPRAISKGKKEGALRPP